MNYGKKKAAKRQKKITSKSTMQGKRIVVRLFKALLICIILAAVVGVAGGGLFMMILLMSPHLTLNRKDLPLSSTPMTAAQKLNDLYLPVPTGYTNPLMRYRKICNMLLLRLRMSVFTNTTVQICRVLPVPQQSALQEVVISPKVPVLLHSS